MSDRGQALLEGLRVVAGDLLIETGAGQGEHIDRGEHGLLVGELGRPVGILDDVRFGVILA